MILFKRQIDLSKYLSKQRLTSVRTGFVPTMGALHDGHLSLIRQSKERTDLTVCSIFVNPVQFDNSADFQKYPVTLEKDIQLLEEGGADILFLPSVEEMYPEGLRNLEHYELGYLETILEGKYRPGHFQGVCAVMHRLLCCVQPDLLFMGQKDYQQCLIVQKLLDLIQSDARFIGCPTLRLEDGLAMSSRNMRLTAPERKNAAAIYQSLVFLKQHLVPGSLTNIIREAKSILGKSDFIIDYVEIADALTLQILEHWDGKQGIVALIAAFQHEIRLIDNMVLYNEHN